MSSVLITASGAVAGALLLGFVGWGNYTARIEFECSFALTKLKTAGRVTNPQRGIWTLTEAGRVRVVQRGY